MKILIKLKQTLTTTITRQTKRTDALFMVIVQIGKNMQIFGRLDRVDLALLEK